MLALQSNGAALRRSHEVVLVYEFLLKDLGAAVEFIEENGSGAGVRIKKGDLISRQIQRQFRTAAHNS